MSVFLKTSLEGRIRNSPDFKNEALLPIFEAVVNSIDAIQEADRMADGYVEVRILRHVQKTTVPEEQDEGKIYGFEIIDNGVGFDDNNYESFNTADSTYKLDKGRRGIGRFLWLKAFDLAEIDSVYSDGNGKFSRRAFTFSVARGVAPQVDEEIAESECRTSVRLTGFNADYRDAASAYKTTEKIAQRILEHCLAYYISHQAPHVAVVDQASDKEIDLNDGFEEIRKDMEPEDVVIKGKAFTLHHLRLFHTYADVHQIVYCANGRGVKSCSLQTALGTSTQFDEKDRKYFYAAYVISDYLDATVDAYRRTFDIPDKPGELQFQPLSMQELDAEVIRHVKARLSSVLESINTRKRQMVDRYVADESPMLRAVVKHCPEVLDDIELNSSNERMCEVLYSRKGKVELDIKKKSQQLLKTQASSIAEIEEEYRDIIEKLDDLQKDELAGYLVRRKLIIGLLEKKLELNTEGQYSNEDIIHDIVFPRKAESDDINFEDHNLWLIDEGLAFHMFACSDKELRSVSSSGSKDRPDVVVCTEVGDDKIARAVSFIEFKKPQRERYDEDPTRQLYDYLREITERGTFKLRNGRVVGVNTETRFYCYAVCDLTDPIVEFAVRQDYAKLQGEFGYYKYSRNLNAHTTIVDFNKLVVDATKRHKAFFEKLGL